MDSASPQPPPLRGSWAKGSQSSLGASQPAPVRCQQSNPLVSLEQQVLTLQETMEQLEPEVKFAIHALETENNKLDAESRTVFKEQDVHVWNFQVQVQPTSRDSGEITHSLEGKFDELR